MHPSLYLIFYCFSSKCPQAFSSFKKKLFLRIVNTLTNANSLSAETLISFPFCETIVVSIASPFKVFALFIVERSFLLTEKVIIEKGSKIFSKAAKETEEIPPFIEN